MGNPILTAASRFTTEQGEFSLSVFETLLVQLMDSTDVNESDSPVVRAMRRFLSRHKAYCGGYLLKHLGMALWVWKIQSTCSSGDSASVSVEITVMDDDLIDLHIIIPVPSGYLKSSDYFDHRFVGIERAIYLVFQDVLPRSATEADRKDLSHLPDKVDV